MIKKFHQQYQKVNQKIQIQKMKSLSGLTSKIREWNSMGMSMLPTLELAIIHSSSYDKEVVQFLQALGPMDLLYEEKTQNIKAEVQVKKEQISQQEPLQEVEQVQQQKEQTIIQYQKQQTNAQQTQPAITVKKSLVQQWDPKLNDSIYAIYLINQRIQARVHLIIDQQVGGKIDDQTLKVTKKIIQRLKRNKSIIFVNFNTIVHKLDVMSDHIEQFGLSFKTKERQIKVDQIISKGNTTKSKKDNKNRSKMQPTDNKTHAIAKKEQPKIDQNLKISISNPPIIKPPSKIIPNSSIQQKLDPQFSLHVRQQLNSLFSEHPLNLSQALIGQIEKKYLSVFGVDINKNFTQMKAYHKQIVNDLKRYQDIMNFIEKDKILGENLKDDQEIDEQNKLSQKDKKKDNKLTSYGLNCLYQSKQYLISSLWGTYSNIQIYREPTKNNKSQNKRKTPSTNRRSLHWQIMQIMNEIWDIEGDFLMKQLDKMPLSYIQERYKMLDYQTIGGFMPSSCFEAIFAGPLKKMVQHIMETLEIVQMKIVNEVKSVLKYFFAMTNLSDEIADIQSQEIKKICSKFRTQAEKVLRSQIQFISVSHDEFWSFKQIKSSLYGPQQQAYIEIKYIGKNYTKKVFDGIRETLPRLIGQNLLREIVTWLQSRSVEMFMSVLIEKGLNVQISERELEWIQLMKVNQKKVDKLVYFFSLKTSSQTGVKHLHQNMQKNWNRMFRNTAKSSLIQQKELQVDRKGGFFVWAKNLLKINKNSQKKRSSSQQKENKFEQIKDQKQNLPPLQTKKISTLTQKNWLLIINIDKPVEDQKIKRSSEQGFPQRLRPSIWLYLAKRQINQSVKKVQTFLNQGANVSSNEQKLQIAEIYKQIEKDVNRTPPPNLFRKGYLNSTLTRVLQAYSIYDKELRYTQGMNFIVGIILCVLTHYGENCEYVQERIKSKAFFEVLQNQCFLIFMYIMQKKGLRKIMFIERATITDLCVRLQEYIKRKSVIMHQKIQRSGFNVEVIFSGALISGLTTSQIQFKLQKRVVDMLLAHEFNVLYKIIGQFVSTAETLCGNMENENLYYFLKGKVYNDVFKHVGDEGLAQMFHNL